MIDYVMVLSGKRRVAVALLSFAISSSAFCDFQPVSGYPQGGTKSFPGGSSAYSGGSDSYGGFAGAEGPRTASCTGNVKYLWTWEGTNPPQSALIKVVSRASWFGNGAGPTVAGVVSDGLGDPQVDAIYPPAGSSSGTHYVSIGRKDDGTYEYDISPSASMTNGSCSVSIQAAVVGYMTISVQGGLNGLGESFLVGQQCQATANVTATGSGESFTAKSYSWAISGGKPIAGFKTTTSAYLSTGHPTPLASPLSGQNVNCYFTTADRPTISCAVVATTPIGDFSFSAQKKTTTVVPDATFTPTPGDTILFNDGSTSGDPFSISLTDHGANGTQVNPQGMVMTGVVTTPSEYGSGNGWQAIQLIQLGRSRVLNGATQTEMSGIDEVGWFTSGLDLILPMAPATGFFLADGNPGQPKPHDTPGETLKYAGGATSYTIGDAFNTFMMYTPPDAVTVGGTNLKSIAVPLKKITWSWGGSALRNTDGTWGPLTGATNPNPATGTDSFGAFPEWDHLINLGHSAYRGSASGAQMKSNILVPLSALLMSSAIAQDHPRAWGLQPDDPVIAALDRTNSRRIGDLIKRAHALTRQKKFDEAEAACRIGLAICEDPQAKWLVGLMHGQLGETYLAEGLYRLALKELEPWVSVGGSSRSTTANLVLAYLGCNRPEDALKVFIRLKDSGDIISYPEAAPLLNKVAVDRPLTLRILALYLRGYSEPTAEAVEDLTLALKLMPKDPSVALLLANRISEGPFYDNVKAAEYAQMAADGFRGALRDEALDYMHLYKERAFLRQNALKYKG